MVELPTGTVTFLFTDIEGSTRLLKQFGALYGELLAQHQRILRDAAATHGGREIDTQGDSFFFAFPRANAALGAAVVAQRALAEHDWPENGQVRVRMALHTGEPLVGEKRYVGLGVHRAARIGAVGHGGQVLLSNATRELVEDEVGGVSVRELGSYRLKDIDRPERLFQLDIEGLQTQFPPLKAEKVSEPHRISRRTVLGAALAAVMAAAIAIPIFALGQGDSGGGSIDAAAGNSVVFVDSDSGRLTADVPVGTAPTDVAIGDGAVWVTNAGDGTVDRIDPESGTVRQTIRVGDGPAGIAFGVGSIWVANGASGTVSRIDPRSNERTQTISVGNGPGGIAVRLGHVWVVNRDDHTLSRIDARTGDPKGTFQVPGGPVEVAVDSGSVWVTAQAAGKVVRVDPRTGRVVDSVSVGRGPGAIAAAADGVWVANSLDDTVSRIDPESTSVAALVQVGDGPAGIAVTPDSVWVSAQFDGLVERIDPKTNLVAERVETGGNPTGLAAVPEGVFSAIRPAGGAHRGGTLTVVEDPIIADFFESLDPGRFLSQRLSSVYDGLTAFRRTGGKEGTQVVPDLAVSLPESTDAGTTYTFRLRKGIRYSTGKLVRAGDVRHALERAFALSSGEVPYLYSSIVGADACARRPKSCNLSKGIVVDDVSRTITFRLTKPDPDLFGKLALGFAAAVPQGLPSPDVSGRPLPGTGPYRIASASKRQLRLTRNPFFREWSRAAKPDGYPDEIVIEGFPVAARIAAVARGRADFTDVTLNRDLDIPKLRARLGGLLRSHPAPFVEYTFLNTRIPPFDDVRVRRALNYAVDREAIVEASGGADRASPSCQIIPANFPGYREYCPYERDLDTARRLVAASGTKGTPVVVWARRSFERPFSLLIDALRELGYPARLELVDDAAYFEQIDRAGLSTIQAGDVGFGTSFPSTAELVQSFLGFLEPLSRRPDPAVEREIRRALRLQETDAIAANEVWARVDRLLVDRALLVPLYNFRVVHVISARAGNHQVHPYWDVLLDQMWVR